MAITYVSSAAAESTTLAMPSHQAGDLLVMFGYYLFTSAVKVTMPTGWNERNFITGFNRNVLLAWRIADSGAVTSGTWSNATYLACSVYRSNTSKYLFPGHAAVVGEAGVTNLNYPALDPLLRISKAPDSWVLGAIGTESDTTANTAPTGMTNRVSLAGTAGEIAIHDSNGALAWASIVSVACTSTRTGISTLEIFESTATIGGGSGGVPLIGTGGLVY